MTSTTTTLNLTHITSHFRSISMLLNIDMYITIHTESVGMLIIYLHSKQNFTYVLPMAHQTAVKSKGKYGFCMVTVPPQLPTGLVTGYGATAGGVTDSKPYSPDLAPRDFHLLGPGTCITHAHTHTHTHIYIYTYRYVMQLNTL
jgi:hypothetical protein